MNTAENRKIVKAMLAPYHMLKQIEEVLKAADVAERTIPELQKQIAALHADVAQQTAVRDQHVEQCKAAMALHEKNVNEHAAKCSKEIEEAAQKARNALTKIAEQNAADLESQRATHNVAKKRLTDEIAKLTKTFDERVQAVNALEERYKAAQDALNAIREKVVV